MIFLIILCALISNTSSQLCQQCANRRMLQYGSYPTQQQKNYNFNFEKFFSQFPGFNAPSSSQSAPSSPTPSSRVFNVYGQDAEAFGSAIGKSIGQRIQQAFSHQDPTYDIQFTPPTSSASSGSSASVSPTYAPSSSSSYGSSPSTYPTSPSTSYPSTSWPSTHPPEDLPTVRQAFQQQQQQTYGSSISTPQSSNGFGGLPGMLPPPSDCPWCTQNGYRGKRIPNKEEEKKNEKV